MSVSARYRSRFQLPRRRPSAAPREAIHYLDDLPLAVIGFTRTGIVAYANTWAGDLFGTTPGQLIGCDFPDLGMQRVSDNHHMRRFSRWLKNRAAQINKSGIVYVRIGSRDHNDVIAVRLARVDTAGPIALLATMWKPSRMTSVEEELGNILQYAGDPIVAVGSEGRIEFFNRAAARAFGYDESDVNGELFSKLLADKSDESIEQASRIWRVERNAESPDDDSGPILLKCATREGLVFNAECVVSHTDFIGKGLNTVILRDVSHRLSDLEEARRQIGLDRIVLENMEEGIVVYDKDYTLIAFNTRLLDMFDLPVGTLQIGAHRDDIIKSMSEHGVYGMGDPDPEFYGYGDEAGPDLDSFAEDELILPKGRILSARRRRLPGGGFVATYRDVTDTHRNQMELEKTWQRLQESEGRLRAIVNSSGDAIVTLDSTGRITTANPTASDCFGQAEDKIIGQHITGLFPEFPFFSLEQKGFVGEVPALFRGELLGVRNDGSRFPVELVMYAVEEADGRFYGLDIRDMSQQRSMQEQLAQVSKLSILGEMAAGMAHELNQPLSVMRMAADNALMRIERGQVDIDDLIRTLELISGQAGKLGSNILNLKIFARREEGSQRRFFDPADAIRSACQLLQGKLSLDSIDLEVSLPETDCNVQGGMTQFEQVMVNLISNAQDAILEKRQKAAESGRDRVRIRMRDMTDKENRICITVTDSGAGIPDDIRPRIFEPFLTSKEAGKGTGLGLSISKEIITVMKGTIRARNVSGGARFEISLPAYSDTKEEKQAVSLPVGESALEARGTKNHA